MVRVQLELDGEVADVIWALRRVSGVAPDIARSPAGLQTVGAERKSDEPPTVPGRETGTTSAELTPARWTEELSGDFMAGLDPVARRMMLHVWRAGESGIHRSALCQRTELTPAELRSLLMRVGHAPQRFQREAGMTLPRPVVGNSPLQRYFVDPDFAAVAASWMFGERTPDQLADFEERP